MRNTLRILIHWGALPLRPRGRRAADVRLASLAHRRTAEPVRAASGSDLVGARWSALGQVELALRTARGARLHAGSRSRPAEDCGPAHGASVAEPLDGRGGSSSCAARHPCMACAPIFVNGRTGPDPGAAASATVATPRHPHAREWGRREHAPRGPAVRPVRAHGLRAPHGDDERLHQSQAPAILRSIYAYHVQANGWNDIGYNYLVDRFGQIYEGRYGGITRNVVGAQTLGFNTAASASPTSATVRARRSTDAARRALVSLISWRLDLAHVDPRSTTPMVSGGNPKYAAEPQVTLRASRAIATARSPTARETRSTRSCPRSRRTLMRAGLPKIFAPAGERLTSYPVRSRRDALGIARVDRARARCGGTHDR